MVWAGLCPKSAFQERGHVAWHLQCGRDNCSTSLSNPFCPRQLWAYRTHYASCCCSMNVFGQPLCPCKLLGRLRFDWLVFTLVSCTTWEVLPWWLPGGVCLMLRAKQLWTAQTQAVSWWVFGQWVSQSFFENDYSAKLVSMVWAAL